MKAPEFWRHDGALARLLAPAAWAYRVGVDLNRRRVTPARADAPVVCIGNLVAGGAGKTPTALAIAGILRRRGRQPHFLTRGYGGRLAGPVRVDPARHRVADVGDEALLLAARAPTWLAHDRVAGATAAVADGADAIVMDDGFQNPSLIKDLSILVIDAGYGLGNTRLLPAGPLREPAAQGFGRANAIVLIETAGASRQAPLPALPKHLPVLAARLVPDEDAMRFAGQPVFAFAGIGRPEKFFQTVRSIGAELVGQRSFRDHHVYDPQEIMRMVEDANAVDAIPVTTAKDHVRLPVEAQPMVEILNVHLAFDAPTTVMELLDSLAVNV